MHLCILLRTRIYGYDIHNIFHNVLEYCAGETFIFSLLHLFVKAEQRKGLEQNDNAKRACFYHLKGLGFDFPGLFSQFILTDEFI